MIVIKSFVVPMKEPTKDEFINRFLVREGLDGTAVVGMVNGSGVSCGNGDITVYYKSEEPRCPKCFSMLAEEWSDADKEGESYPSYHCVNSECDYFTLELIEED